MRMIDLFCGIGGFRVALEPLDIKCVFSSEIDDKAADAYYQNFGEKPHGDIKKIPAEFIPPHDILCAGFPCQSFSIAGNRKGFDDERGQLFWDIVRIAKHHQPKLLMLENVARILSADKGEIYRTIESLLNEIGYDLHYALLNAGDFGIPQSRKRWYGVAIHRSTGWHWTPPEPTYKPCCVRDLMFPDDAPEVADMWLDEVDVMITHPKNIGRGANRLLRVGHIKRRKDKGTDDESPAAQGYRLWDSSGIAQTFVGVNGIDQGSGHYAVAQSARVYDDTGHSVTLAGSKRCGGGGAATGMYLVESDKHIKVSQTHTIYEPEGHSACLQGSGKTAHGGQALCGSGLVHSQTMRVRRLHNEEMKRLMGFPDNHYISEGRHGRSQCGNAVIPQMVRAVFKNRFTA